MFLAQANIATYRWPLDDPRMSEFAAQIAPVNQLAAEADGFIWRFDGSLTPRDIGPPWDDPLLFFNMSVWRDLDSLQAFVSSPRHSAVVKNRAEWVKTIVGPSSALWWISETTHPTLEDAVAAIPLRLSQFRSAEAPNITQFVEQLERSVWQAVIANDGPALEQLFADDYIEITLEGKRIEKGAVVEESPHSDDITAYSMDRATVVMPADGTLLLSYHVTIEGTFRGEEILPRDRWATSIWRCGEDGSWKCCFFQQSPFHRK